MRVFVYFNLHKKVWSIKALEGENKGRVIAHRTLVTLENCELKVSQAGRKRVIAERRKNVHAGVVGEWHDAELPIFPGRMVTYNPYKYETFVDRETLQPVKKASRVNMAAYGTPSVIAEN